MSTREKFVVRAGFALAISSVLLTIAPARAAAATSPTTVRFVGRGYGHGVGMSQYGAYAQALAGRTTAEILRHYYDGVSFKTRAAETIRVLVESGADVVVTSDASFGVWRGTTRLVASTAEKPFLRAVPTTDGYALQRAASRTGTWTTEATATGPVLFKPGNAVLRLVFDGGASRTYRANIEARRTSSTRIHAINLLDLDHYIRGVVPWEMPASWPMESLKVQAMAARSYAVNQKLRQQAAGNWYHICATTSCQVYGGLGAENSRTNSAIQDTARRVITHPDDATTAAGVILAVFSSSSGGKTESNTAGFGSSVQYPYLRSVADPWSLDPEVSNPYASWERTASRTTVASAVGLDSVSSVRVVSRNLSGSADDVEFTGVKAGVRTVVTRTGRWTRSTFSLPSIYIARVYTPPFYDDDGLSMEADIAAVWRAGISAGCGTARFCPRDEVTRAEMATFLARAMDLPPATVDHFTDDDGTTHEANINRLAEAGIIGGCGEDLVCPDQPVTRAQMASFLARALALPESTTDHFTDDDGSTHESAIDRLADAGISGGCTTDHFCPDITVSRGLMARFLARAFDLP